LHVISNSVTMHSPFTYNPNAHRASNYQQQSGHQQPVYAIGAPYTGFMTHPAVMNQQTFARSFASVVSCERDLTKHQNCQNGNNMGIINSFMRHFNQRPQMPHYQKIQHQNKEFEDFTRMPSLPASNYIHTQNHPQQHFYQQPHPHHINMKVPFVSGQFYPQSANDTNNPTRSFMASFFGGYQQCPQPQAKPKQRKWFGRGFRCGRGGGNRWRNSKFHENDVNLQKNFHEKERTIIEHDIHDDICDFVNVDEKDVMAKDVCDSKASSNNPNETAKGSCDDPPFMIYSLEEFPAIVPAATTPPTTVKPKAKEKCEKGFVVLPQDASKSTPCFVPRRFTLCEKVEQMIKSSPTRINGYLKPCLKQSRRRFSECSDFEIEFMREPDEGEEANEIEFSDDDETDSDDEDDGVDGLDGLKCDEEDDFDEDDEEEAPEHQLDSGVEERRVSFRKTWGH
jgi:hypothetical protein